MGNKIVPLPAPVKKSIWQNITIHIFSFSTMSKVITVCSLYVIWKGFSASCSSCDHCDHKKELLRRILEDTRDREFNILKRKKVGCSYLIQQLKRVIAYLPTNDPNAFQLNEELSKLNWCIRRINEEKETFTVLYQGLMDFEYTPFEIFHFPYPADVKLPTNDCLDKLIHCLLTQESQESLEQVFWNSNTPAQREFLDKLMRRLKTAYPHVSESKLRFGVAYVYNEQKRAVIPDNLNVLEKCVIKVLETVSLRGQDDKEICPICFDEIINDKTVTQCKHFFHAECILPVIASGGKCPLCRAYLKVDPPNYSTCSTKRKHHFKHS